MHLKNPHILLVILLLLGITHKTSAQREFFPGYLIQLNNDTIHGLISLRSASANSQSCEYKSNDEGSIQTYLPGEIVSYRIPGKKYYVSKQINTGGETKTVFLEFIINGIVNLYCIKEGQYFNYYIEKDGELVALTNEELKSVDKYNTVSLKKSNRYKGALMVLFEDAPEVQKKAQSTQFNARSLAKITNEYHDAVCTDYACINYTKSTSARIYIEPMIGYSFSQMGLKTSSDKLKDNGATAGINFRFVPSMTHHRWNLYLGLSYASEHFEGRFTNTLYYKWPVNYDITLSYSILRIPLTIEYNFPHKKIQPSLFIGTPNAVILSPEYTIEDGSYGDPKSLVRKFQFGVYGGAGLRLHLNNGNYLALKAYYEYRVPAENSGYIFDYTNVNGSHIALSYGFKLR